MSRPKPPRTFKSGTRVYSLIVTKEAWAKVVLKERDAAMRGITHHEDLTVHVAPGMALALEQEIVAHEVGHCVADVCGLEADLSDEKQRVSINDEAMVLRASPVWFQIIRDNPELIAYWQHS